MDQLEQIRSLVARGYTPTQAAALVTSGGAGNGGNGSGGAVNPVDAAIKATAARAGMDEPTWRAIAHIESTLNPSSNYNRGTQYKGLFQIGSRGSDSEWATHGSGNIYNPMDNATAAANLAYENNQWFKSRYGRDPTPIETYMMHQQGRGFYQNNTMTNIIGNLPPDARTPENMTHAGFEAYWARQLERRANLPPGSLMASAGDRVPVSAGEEGGAGTAAAPRGAIASLSGTTPVSGDTTLDASGQGSIAKAIAGVTKQLEDAQQANQPPPLQPLQIAQPLNTPAMQRARALAQAMLARQMTGDTTL